MSVQQAVAMGYIPASAAAAGLQGARGPLGKMPTGITQSGRMGNTTEYAPFQACQACPATVPPARAAAMGAAKMSKMPSVAPTRRTSNDSSSATSTCDAKSAYASEPESSAYRLSVSEASDSCAQPLRSSTNKRNGRLGRMAGRAARRMSMALGVAKQATFKSEARSSNNDTDAAAETAQAEAESSSSDEDQDDEDMDEEDEFAFKERAAERAREFTTNLRDTINASLQNNAMIASFLTGLSAIIYTDPSEEHHCFYNASDPDRQFTDDPYTINHYILDAAYFSMGCFIVSVVLSILLATDLDGVPDHLLLVHLKAVRFFHALPMAATTLGTAVMAVGYGIDLGERNGCLHMYVAITMVSLLVLSYIFLQLRLRQHRRNLNRYLNNSEAEELMRSDDHPSFGGKAKAKRRKQELRLVSLMKNDGAEYGATLKLGHAVFATWGDRIPKRFNPKKKRRRRALGPLDMVDPRHLRKLLYEKDGSWVDPWAAQANDDYSGHGGNEYEDEDDGAGEEYMDDDAQEEMSFVEDLVWRAVGNLSIPLRRKNRSIEAANANAPPLAPIVGSTSAIDGSAESPVQSSVEESPVGSSLSSPVLSASAGVDVFDVTVEDDARSAKPVTKSSGGRAAQHVGFAINSEQQDLTVTSGQQADGAETLQGEEAVSTPQDSLTLDERLAQAHNKSRQAKAQANRLLDGLNI